MLRGAKRGVSFAPPEVQYKGERAWQKSASSLQPVHENGMARAKTGRGSKPSAPRIGALARLTLSRGVFLSLSGSRNPFCLNHLQTGTVRFRAQILGRSQKSRFTRTPSIRNRREVGSSGRAPLPVPAAQRVLDDPIPSRRCGPTRNPLRGPLVTVVPWHLRQRAHRPRREGP